MAARRWTPKGAIARSSRNLERGRERLIAVALEWGDIDQGIVDEAESLIRLLEEFDTYIQSSVTERLQAGEHVGL